MNTLAFVLAAMGSVAPQSDHTELAAAIARVVDEQPEARSDRGRQQLAALVVAVAFREGSLRTRVEGDFDGRGRPRSFCTMQIHRSVGGSPALNDDPELCVRTGLELLRQSKRVCPSHPIAFYAAGPRGCASPRARRISNDRVALAKRIEAAAREALAAAAPAMPPQERRANATLTDKNATVAARRAM